MRVLIRHKQFRVFYAGSRRWVGDPESAVSFEDEKSAARFALEEELSGTELVSESADPLPMGGSFFGATTDSSRTAAGELRY